MDERHWWIATKIQESFHIGGFDNPTLLEDFLCESRTLELINQFLNPNGPAKIFCCCDKPQQGTLSTRDLFITTSLANLKVSVENTLILYFLRLNTNKEVDPVRMERDIFCGELKQSAAENLTLLLSHVFLPVLRAQKDWGQCSDEQASQCVHNLEKYLGVLSEYGASTSATQQLLKKPEILVSSDFKQYRAAAFDETIVGEYETLVSDWIITIDSILADGTAEERLMDMNAGPLTELERWRRRQRTLNNITEQLKSKDCKNVIGILITAKSKLLKKWKTIDACITDAANETKDKVKYLESVRKHLEQLYHDSTPVTVLNVALPGLTTSVKQMDSISRFYARSGYLGLLFSKVTNQLVQVCKDYIRAEAQPHEHEDLLWDKVHTEVQDGPGRTTSPHGGARKKKGAKDLGLVVPDDEKLCERLNVCLTLYSHYKDSLRSIRDGLGGTHALSHFPSMSSLHSHRSHSQVGRRSIGGPSRSRMSTLQPSVSSKKAPSVTSSSGNDEGPHGISFTDEDTILQHLDTFCQRLRQFLEVIDTLKQFHSLKEKCRGLPRPRREDLIGEDEDDRDSNADAISVAKPPPDPTGPPENPPSPMKTLMVPSAHGMMPVLEEEEPMSMPGSRMALNNVDSPGHGHEASEAMSLNAADEIHELNTQSRAVSKQAAHHLARLYARHEGEEDGPSISHILQMYLEQMTDNFAQVVNTGVLLDVEGKDKDRFEEAHQQFQETAQLLDSMMCAYLQATFQRKMQTNECINILQRFAPVGARQGIRATIAEKYVETFQHYEVDLEHVQQMYEREKEEPPIPRNAPPVAGSIFWCRKLLTAIEDPMKVFRDTKAITHLKDFQRVVKLYNRIATTLVTFETLWLQQWKAYIDGAKNGLKAMLLVHHPQTGEILVNADERILQLIQESRWMVRLGIPMPESVQDIVAQEHRFKSYKMHLEQCLQEYKEVCAKIPPPMKQLFLVHTEATLHYFQPGLTTLTWNSMNIDAFLHTVHSAIARLDDIVQHVINIVEEQVQGTIDIVSSMVLFDMELAFSKAWPPGEFGEAMLQSVEEKGQELLDFVNEVESAIFEIVSFLMSNKVGSPSQSPIGSRVSTAPSHHPRRGSKAASQRDTPMTLQTLSEVTEDLVVNELLEHYCQKVYDAVLSATSRSLAALAEASGCEGECLKQTLARGSPRSTPSRASTGVSSRSGLSMSWTSPEADEVTFLRFEVVVKFNIPNTVIEPPLAAAQEAVNQVASAIMDISNGVNWWTSEGSETFHSTISEEPYLNDLMHQLFSVIDNLQKAVDRHIFHFKLYDFLWKDDMHTQFYEFISADPGTRAIKREVERLLNIEQKVLDIPLVLPVGPICLLTSPIRDALHGFSIAWKTKYAQVLHEDAKKMLDTAILYRSNVLNRLSLDVRTLDQLNSALNLLQELQDMENKIDDIYLPIETMYENLRDYKLRLPRNEVQEVEQLREKWQELIELSEQVRYKLLKEQRGAFEQELDKQVKNFVVEVIQFRNSFDAQGPAVPGVRPEEAVMRLRDFQERFALYDAKRRTLDSVSRLFGIVPKPFPELDKTGEELDLLGLLYGLFQKFIAFDSIFRERLWAEVDLEQANKEVEEYWEECLALPDKLKDWEAYQEMKNSIKIYLDVFPLLHRLATKEIRNRHWLQVMSVTGSSFPLEAQAFKLFHLLDIGLIQHHDEIHEICKAASIELELEIKMRTIEEEWTEQVLTFEPYKKRGAIYLAKDESERLLEQLEDAQALLATMLTSKHIGPLREEAASWAEKLKGVSEVLETWLEVQDLWQYLEAVFSNSAAAKELPQEAKRFIRIDKSWIKLMRKTYDTRNVLQCCYGGEIPKGVVLRHFREDLEVCFKSLTSYLDNKRKAFPRFFFLSDPVLLSILSRPHDLESVRPHLKSIFSYVSDVKLEKTEDTLSSIGEKTPVPSFADYRRPGAAPVPRAGATTPRGLNLPPVERFPGPMSSEAFKRSERSGSIHLSESNVDETSELWQAATVVSPEGELLELDEEVSLTDGVETWLQSLQQSIHRTIAKSISRIVRDIGLGVAMEEWAFKYPAQVARLGLLYYWTKECELAVSELKYERKAIPNASKKFSTVINRLPTCLTRGAWKGLDEPFLPIHKLRLQNMITYSLYLRDTLESLGNRKLRDVTDFEWRRNIRFYMHESGEGSGNHQLCILDGRYEYGCEFLGGHLPLAMTALTERCFLTMSQALTQLKGSAVVGGTGVGKTETVKGLAYLLGRYMAVFACLPQMDSTALGKIIQGLAADGSWGLFDNFHNLNRSGVGVLLELAQSIYTALRANKNTCHLADGQEVPVDPYVATFITINKDVSRGFQLPQEIRALYRNVSLVLPDLGLILRGKVAGLGFKSPKVLADRLKLMADLCRDQLPKEHHHHFSLAALTGVISHAYKKKKNLKEEKQAAMETMSQVSRSNSVISLAIGSQAGFSQTTSTTSTSKTTRSMSCSYAGGASAFQAVAGTVQHIRAAVKRHSCDIRPKTKAPLVVSQKESEPVTFQKMAKTVQQMTSVLASPSWEISPIATTPPQRQPSAGPSDTNPMSPSPSINVKIGERTRKAGNPNMLTPAAKVEHAMVSDALQECIAPRLKGEDLVSFTGILKDTFAGLPDTELTRQFSLGVEPAMVQKAQEKGLIPHVPWISKCMSLYALAQVHKGIIVAGPPASGKSSCIATLVEALSSISAPTPSTHRHGKSAMGTSHKLLRLNPLVVDDYGLVFGHLNQNHDWVDGIFTHAYKKACRNKCTTWLCLDGPLNAGWADNFSSVLDSDNTFHLPNGDRLPLSDNVRLLFETTDLTFASPATISRAGIVYMDKNVLGWRPIAQAWLESRPHHENLQRAFNKTLDAVSNFVINEAKTKVPVCEVGMFQNCLNLLKAMLDDNVEIGGELHVERLYLFCLIWTFGGLLQGPDRQAFSNLLTSLTSALPDYDHEISVFDYYVDESGEWDPWTSRVQEDTYPDNANISGEVFVETVDTIRCQVLMDYALSSGQNVLLVGPPGSGKTSLINDLIDTQDPATHIVKRLVWSSASEASQLQTFVEANIHHRQGFVYGAKDYKGFQIFIDDINMPARDDFGVQRVNENLRELLDHHILLKLQKPFEWRTVEGLSVLATLTLHEYPSTSTQLLSERLIRHFTVIHLPAPQGQDLESVVNSMLEANMSFDGQGLDTELHTSLTAASCELLTTVQDVLRPSPMPGRQHYMFTLRNIAKAFQCMKRLTSESRADEKMVVGLWRHEVWHIMENSICRKSDKNWFNHNLQEILNKHFPSIEEETLPPHFVTFPIDGRAYQRPVTTMSTDKKIRVALQAITSMKEVQETLASHLASYNERFRNEQLDVLLCEYVFQHIARVHRVLSFQNGGNLLMIGAIGSHLVTMVKLALHIADVDMYHVDCSRANTFFDGLRSAVRMTGSEGKMLTLLFTAKDLHNEAYLDAINSLLVCGEYPPLFSNDELEGLLQVLGPAMKKAYAHLMSNPMKFFVSRVKSNLKIVICLPPKHRLLSVAASQYPGLLTSCQVNWVCAWTQECLLDKANYFVEKYNLVPDNQEMRDKLVTVMANIHSYVLQDCRQIPWAGNMEETVSLTMCKRDSKKDQYKTQMLELPNLPYSKTIMHERILLQHKGAGKVSHRSIPMGPTLYRRFMECFLYVLSTKTAQQNANITRLKKALSTLSQTREDAKLMEEKIKVVQADYEEAQKKTAGLLRQLTGKATTLEKLKAQLGGEGSLGAYLQLNEVSSEEEEEDDLLKQDDIGEDSDAIEMLMASYIRSTRVMEEYSTIKHRQYRSHWKSHDRDEYDDEFDRMRKENMKSRKLQVVEELAAAKKAVEDAKKALEGSRKKVLQWRDSVSRQCVERIRAFQNPPVLVALVMDMIMTLLGRRKIPKQDTGDEKEGKNSQTDRTSSASSLSFKPLVKRETKRQMDSSRRGSTGTKDGDKVDRNEWKKLQHAMSDSVKFVEMVHRVPWQDGLHPDVLAAVQSYLASGKNGDAGPTGEGSLLEAGMSASTLVSPRRSGGASPPGLTIAGVRYSSEDAAVLLQYTIAIVEYTQLCGPLQIAKERLQNLQDEIEESERLEKEQEVELEAWTRKLRLRVKKITMRVQEPEEPQISLLDHVEEEEEELGPNDLPIIQGEVDRLQEEFDEAVMEKHRLENELHNCHERLRAATETIKSLREQELLWQQSVEENSSNDLLLSNCIAASAFLTYCGPMSLDGRNSMYEFFLHVCEHYGLPIPNKMLYRDIPLVNFLYTDVQIKQLELQGLPTNPVALDSSCFVTETLSNNSWVLLCDPTSRAIPWLIDYLKEGFIIAKYHDLKSQLETCLTEGLFLILTDIDLHLLAKDNRFNHVFRRRMSFLTGKAPFKIIVGSHEVECRPGFRLYMHTTCMPHEVPDEVAAYTSMVNFYQDRSGIEAELLDRFIRLEKTRVQDERTNLAQEKISNMERLALLEDQMLNLLASDTRLLNNLAVTKKLADMKKQFDETQDSQQKIEVSEAAIRRNCEQFRTIATRAAVLFDASRHMREINSCYQISFDQFLAVFDAAIKHSERASTDTVVDRLTYSAYMTTARSLFERDKLLFALLVSMELEDSEGRLGPGEREFIISPTFASTVMSTMGYGVGSDARANARKPFDWMLDDQYHNLQVLAVYYQWFQDAFDKLPKDGREMPWRTLCENDKPELAALPDKMDDYYTPMQRYCVIRALRSDRIMHASSNFVSKVLGKKYAGEIPLDLPSVLRQSTPQTPIILLYTSESDLAETLFTEFAAKKQEACQVVYMSSGSPQEERRVRRAMAKAVEEGHWLLLHNAHNALHFLQTLDTTLQEKKLPVDSNFRLWVSAQPHPKLPIHLLQHAIKVVVDTPMMMRDHMVRSMQWIEPETLKTSTRPEWPAVLHNLFMVHGALRLRARFGRGGWNRPGDMIFGNNELQEGLRLVLDEFSDTTSTDMPGTPGKGIAWTALRYMLTEVIYGSYVSDEYDQQTLSAMVDYWMGPNAMKKEFEVPRLKHKIPAAFFANYIRYNSLVQALEQIPNFFLDVPEACNMHSFTETLLGDDQYIFTRLNSVYDIMPSSPTLSHVVSPRPPTPYAGPPLTTISATSSLPLVVNRGVFATQTYAALKNRKEQELYELSTTLLTKVPRAWGKEYIADRIKKLGGATAFNVFIQREVEALMKLIGEVRRSLNAIKAAADTVEALPLGDHLSEDYLTVADDLYHYRTPELWCRLGGDAVPPPTWNPAQWLTDLTNRHAHFEKLLSQGREKFPAYWPGAFFQPRALFGLLKSESVKNFTDKYGFVEPLMFQTEITARDKDHLRDPPTEGMFVFGLYLWGCTWEKTTSELLDTPPKSGPSTLPVIHVTCVPQSDKLTDPVKAAETYQCPCYISRTNCREPVLTLDVRHDGITATRWSLRGLAGTLRPF